MIPARCARSMFVGLLSLTSCMASNVVAVEDRGVFTRADAAQWRAATAADVVGWWTSEEVRGPLAAGLRGIHYLLLDDGTYAAAALVDRGEGPEYDVLRGAWSFGDGALRLGGAQPAQVEIADPDLMRLSGEAGVLVLRRAELR